MKIQRETLDDGVSLLTLKGDFDAFAANPFLEQIDAVVQAGVSNVVVNLRLILFINSTAIGCLIKARKRMRGLGGDLVLSESSQRVSDTLASLGLDKVIRNFPSNADAHAHLSQTADESVDIPTENAVLLQFKDAAKQADFQASGRVAKMASLEENGIHFLAKGSGDLFADGTEVKVKFRLPLFRRAYYFDLPCTVRSASTEGDDLRVFAEFGEVFEEDRRSIAQFLRDMRLLKEEIRDAD